MDQRRLLEQINYENQTITLGDQSYALTNFNPIMIDSENPTALSEEEEKLLAKLMMSFQSSERLKRHMDFLIEKGSMYLCYNGNLLLHGCLPLHSNGDLKSMHIGDNYYSGKKLLDFFEQQVRYSYRHPEISDDFATDMLWYLWTGECSSLFGKQAMTTFERYYIEDTSTHEEKKNAYYRLRNDEKICESILTMFGLPTTGHIINGHTPVKAKKGESPVKANGRLLVIDGGFARSYQKETGLAGYTLLSNSYGLQLVAHQRFTSTEEVVASGTDVLSKKHLIEKVDERTKVKDTNVGKTLIKEKELLEKMYDTYEYI